MAPNSIHFFPTFSFCNWILLIDKDFHLLQLPIIILKSSYINWFKIDSYWYIQPWCFPSCPFFPMFSKLTACSPIWDYMIPQFLWPCWRKLIAKEEPWLPERSEFFVNDIDDSPMCILLSGCHSGPDQRSCLSCALPYFPTEHQTYLKPPITSTIVDIIIVLFKLN